MKSLQHSFSILLFFLLLIIANVSSAQVFSNYIHNLGLTKTQKQQSEEIRISISEEKSKLYQELANLTKEGVNAKTEIYNQIKALREKEEQMFIEILLVEQRELYFANKEEKAIEHKNRAEQYTGGRLKAEYPNIDFTQEQISKIVEYESKQIYAEIKFTPEGRRAEKQAKNNMMKSVLTAQQYDYYVKKNREQKIEQEKMILTLIEQYEPIAEELLVIMEEFALPKYKKLRAKLEDKISDRDKAELANIRARRIEHFENDLYSKMDAELNEVENPELIYKAEQITQLVDSYSYIIGFMDEAIARKEIQALVDRYDRDILNLKNELIWLNREIVLKGAKVVDKVYPIPFPEQMIPKQEELSKHEKRMFLLLDPALDFSLDDWNNITKGEGKHQAVAYPSPARKNQTLEFVIKESGKVTVEILDESGRVVRQLFSKNMDAGKQNMNVSVSDLSPQIYFYRITTIENRTMLKFVVVK